MNKDRKRVLHIKRTLNPGGGCMIIYRLAQQLKDDYRFDWMTYCMTGNDWAERFQMLGSRIKLFPGPMGLKHPAHDFKLYRSYIRYIRENGYDIVHLNTEDPRKVRFLICARLAGAKKRIIHAHNNQTTGEIGKFRIAFDKWLIGLFATDYIACSKEAAEWLFPKKGAEKALILKNGLDVEAYRFNPEMRNQMRGRFHIGENDFVIGHSGRMEKQKNHRFLLEIFAEVLKKEPSARLMLIGSGSLEKDIRGQAESLGISDRIIFAGQVDNVQDYLNAMDVFVLPSLFEGLGMVNIEAQTNGLPCVVSNKVAKLAKVSDLLSFHSLDDGAERWAEYILKEKERRVSRDGYADKVREEGWDIRDVAKKLAGIYES